MVGPTVIGVVVRKGRTAGLNRLETGILTNVLKSGRGSLAEDWRVNFGTDQMRYGRNPHEFPCKRYACNHVANALLKM
jgi:hypothetical protein